MYRYILILFLLSLINCLKSQNLDSLKLVLTKTTNDTIKANILIKLSELEEDGKWQIYNDQLYDLAEKQLIATSNKTLIRFYQKKLASASINKGYNYSDLGNFNKAIYHYYKAIALCDSSDYDQGFSDCYNNLGYIFRTQNEFTKAIYYYQKSYTISKQMGDTAGMAGILNNLGSIYKVQNKDNLAYYYFNKALELKTIANDLKGIATALNNIGSLYIKQKKYNEAEHYIEKSLKIRKEAKDLKNLTFSYDNLSKIYDGKNNILKAIEYAEKSFQLSTEIQYPDNMISSSKNLYGLYKKNNDLKNAIKMLEIYTKLNDSTKNEKNFNSLFKLENIQKENEITILNNDKKLKDIEFKNQQKTRYYLIGILIIVASFAIFILYNLYQKNITNKTLSEQKIAIQEQSEKLISKNNLIKQSLEYAKFLQQAALPSKKDFNKYFKDCFIYYKPKDVVSGDFYWLKELNDSIVFAVMDCTGHGVPGAIMSIYGYSILEQAVKNDSNYNPSEIMGRLSKRLYTQLKSKNSELKDGMEIIICKYNLQNKTLEYSSCGHKLYLLRNEQIQEYKGDIVSIGETGNEVFTNYQLQLNDNDYLFLLTDGFPDQKGEETGKKFMYPKLKKLLTELAHYNSETLEQNLDDTFQNWKGKEDQRDDVTVIGLKI